MRTVLIALLLPGLILAEEKPPKCDAKHVGQFWPEPDKNSIEQLARSGDLQVCVRTSTWRYRWEYLTVSVERLKANGKKRRAGHSATS